MTHHARPSRYGWWAVPTAAALVLTGCSGDADEDPSTTAQPTAQTTQSDPSPPEQQDIAVDSSGDPSAGAQTTEGTASLGTAAATIAVQLPGEWQYEGTYGDGVPPYAVLVDASQPFDLSEPGSEAYRESVWVHVETFRVGEDTPFGGPAPQDADEFASLVADSRAGEARVLDDRDVPVVHVATDDEEGRQIDELFARHGDVWILARPSNVDVAAYLDGSAEDGILHAVLESSEIK